MDDTFHRMLAQNLGDLLRVAYIALDHANLWGKAKNHFCIGRVIYTNHRVAVLQEIPSHVGPNEPRPTC